MRQRVDFDITLHFVVRAGAGQRVTAVDIHRAGPANSLTAGSPERQSRVDLILDLDHRVDTQIAYLPLLFQDHTFHP